MHQHYDYSVIQNPDRELYKCSSGVVIVNIAVHLGRRANCAAVQAKEWVWVFGLGVYVAVYPRVCHSVPVVAAHAGANLAVRSGANLAACVYVVICVMLLAACVYVALRVMPRTVHDVDRAVRDYVVSWGILVIRDVGHRAREEHTRGHGVRKGHDAGHCAGKVYGPQWALGHQKQNRLGNL